MGLHKGDYMKSRTEVALDMHHAIYKDRLDRMGVPEGYHSMRVSIRGASTEEKIVGLLHDVVEDGYIPLEDIREVFGSEIATDIDTVTRREGETYKEFIVRIKTTGSRTAICVKVYDLRDNINRALELPPEEGGRLFSRYRRALEYFETGR
jgi:(p)ppGpp synthase/HD superfamily hydrolase